MTTAHLHRTPLAIMFIAGSLLPRVAVAQYEGSRAPREASTIEITATDYAFRAPAAAPSGWTTIRFANDGSEPHFVFMSRLPHGKTIAEYETELSPVFAHAWDRVREGATIDEAVGELFAALPPWFPELHFIGGPGLAAPGRTTETTLLIEPGDYVLECYVKTADGRIHYMEGMVRPITFTQERSAAAPPAADVTVTLSNNRVEFDSEPTAGSRTFAVHIRENPEEGFGHSAHLARLAEDASVDDVVGWMNWFGATGLSDPAPAEFIGGVHFMPAGATAYFSVDLEPGRYLLVSENTGHLGVFREFRVQ
jgi:hypothetical protein